MTKYEIDYIAKEPFVGGFEMDLDIDMSEGAKEDAAIAEIEAEFPALTDIEVVKMVEAK